MIVQFNNIQQYTNDIDVPKKFNCLNSQPFTHIIFKNNIFLMCMLQDISDSQIAFHIIKDKRHI